MGVSPSLEVIVVEVHSAGVPDTSVNHDNLPVVPVVERGDELEEMRSRVGESHDLDTCLLHVVVVSWPDREISYVLEDKPDLDSLPGLSHQDFLDGLAAFVVPKLEIFHVDRLLGFKDILAELIEFAFSGSDYLKVVSVRDGEAHHLG